MCHKHIDHPSNEAIGPIVHVRFVPHGVLMCGIAGLFAKSAGIEQQLGRLICEMMEQLADRGPDSAGLALYREPVSTGTKLSLLCSTGQLDWTELSRRLAADFGEADVVADHGQHAILRVAADAEAARVWLSQQLWTSLSSARVRRSSCISGSAARKRCLWTVAFVRWARHTRSGTRGWRLRAVSQPRGRIRSPPARISVWCITDRSQITTAFAGSCGAGR